MDSSIETPAQNALFRISWSCSAPPNSTRPVARLLTPGRAEMGSQWMWKIAKKAWKFMEINGNSRKIMGNQSIEKGQILEKS